MKEQPNESLWEDAAQACGPKRRPRAKPPHHARDVFHAWMLEGAEYAKPLGMPKLAPIHVDPERLIAFSDAMSPRWNDFDCFVHFFEDDCRIERFWNERVISWKTVKTAIIGTREIRTSLK